MDSLQRIEQTLDYIEVHLKEPLTIPELAKQAHLSTFYFHRLFRELIGTPVMEYIRLRRLAHSASELRSADHRIIDIALEYGFTCHETYTRAFKAAYSISPMAYRRNPVSLNHFARPVLVRKALGCTTGGRKMEPTFVTRPALSMLGVARRFSMANHKSDMTDLNLPGFWQEFFQGGYHQEIQRFAGASPLLGLFADHDEQTGDFTYMIGAEVQQVDAVPANMVLREFPAAEYAIFATDGPVPLETCIKELTDLGEYAFSQWLPATGYVAGAGDLCYFERYGEPDNAGQATVAIWVPIAR